MLSYYQLTVEVVVFDQVCPFDTKLMGSNEPTVEEMKESYFFHVPFTNPNVDVTIIAGKPLKGQNKHYPLLLLRFWNRAVKTNNVKFNKFFDSCLKLIPREGVSVSRLGGSSGTLPYQSQRNRFEFLARPGSFPRKSRGVKFVNRHLYLQCIYVSPYSGQPTHKAKYSPVHRGVHSSQHNSYSRITPF